MGWWERKSSEVKIGLLLLLTLIGPIVSVNGGLFGMIGFFTWVGASAAILHFVGKIREQAEREGEDRALGRPTPFRDRRDFSD
jgi:hypothetical protein